MRRPIEKAILEQRLWHFFCLFVIGLKKRTRLFEARHFFLPSNKEKLQCEFSFLKLSCDQKRISLAFFTSPVNLSPIVCKRPAVEKMQLKEDGCCFFDDGSGFKKKLFFSFYDKSATECIKDLQWTFMDQEITHLGKTSFNSVTLGTL